MEFYHNKLGWGVLTETPKLIPVADSCSVNDDYCKWFRLKALNYDLLQNFINNNPNKFELVKPVQNTQRLHIIDDNLVEGEIVSNLDGKVYSSKSKHRQALKENGMVMIEKGMFGKKKQEESFFKKNEREVREYLQYQLGGA
jgi:hypothetical protein